jgi:thiol-disulfide isomerase/thioredoxin
MMFGTDYLQKEKNKNQILNQLSYLVMQSSEGNLELVDVFEGPHGLTGLIVQQVGNVETRNIAWTTPGGETLIFGEVFDINGKNLNNEYLQSKLGSYYKAINQLKENQKNVTQVNEAESVKPKQVATNEEENMTPEELYEKYRQEYLAKRERERRLKQENKEENVSQTAEAEIERIKKEHLKKENQKYKDTISMDAMKKVNQIEGNFILLGDPAATNVARIYGSPTCPYCKKMYEMIVKKDDLLSNNNLRIEYYIIPNENNVEEVASLIANGYAEKKDYEASKEELAKTRNNMKIKEIVGITAYPTTIWETDGEYCALKGMLREAYYPAFVNLMSRKLNIEELKTVWEEMYK